MARALKYNKEYYRASSYFGFHPLTREQMENEYDRLRKFANRSLSRIAQSEFSDEQFYKQFYGKFEKAGETFTDRELAYQLQDVAYYLANKRSTYTGAREAQRKAVRSLKERGYTWVTYKNYSNFAEFMGSVKAAYGDRMFDSKRIVEFYEQHKAGQVEPETLLQDFEAWVAQKTKA